MDLERIERALRDGPVDEPIYRPGAYGPPRLQRWLMFAGAMAGALVLGVILGLGMDLVRQQPGDDTGPPVDLERLGEELSGSWMSDPFTEEEFARYLTDAGHTPEDIAAFLEHDPIPGTVRWGLDFDGRERLVVFRTVDESRTEILTNIMYELTPDGRLRTIDGECSVFIEFAVDREELTFGHVEVDDCVPDMQGRIAFGTFFGLAPPYRPTSAR